jgi:hypothetical protein
MANCQVDHSKPIEGGGAEEESTDAYGSNQLVNFWHHFTDFGCALPEVEEIICAGKFGVIVQRIVQPIIVYTRTFHSRLIIQITLEYSQNH